MTPAIVNHGHLPLPAWWITFITWVSHLGPVGLLAFMAVFVVATLCCVPGWVLKVSAGFAFGLAEGVVLASAGSILGAAAAFVISRHWMREAVRRRLAGTEFYRRVDGALERRGWRFAFLLRLCPVIPACALNYLFGLTEISFGPYLTATGFGMLPGILVYVYLGYAGRTELEDALRHSWGPARPIVWAIGLLAAVAIVVEILRSRQQTADAGPPRRE